MRKYFRRPKLRQLLSDGIPLLLSFFTEACTSTKNFSVNYNFLKYCKRSNTYFTSSGSCSLVDSLSSSSVAAKKETKVS